MEKKNNPFAIRKSPVSIITAQALNLDDYVQSRILLRERRSLLIDGVAQLLILQQRLLGENAQFFACFG